MSAAASNRSRLDVTTLNGASGTFRSWQISNMPPLFPQRSTVSARGMINDPCASKRDLWREIKRRADSLTGWIAVMGAFFFSQSRI